MISTAAETGHETPETHEGEAVGNVAKLVEAFESIKGSRFKADDLYEECRRALDGISYSLKDVEDACPVIAGYVSDCYERMNAGVFASALLHILKDGDDIVLDFGGVELDYLGMYLDRGRAVIKGDAGDCAGYGMTGGILIIDGHSKDYAGHSMKGGRLTIRGDAEDCIGIYSGSKATIWISGGYESAGPECNARIYHRYRNFDPSVKMFETFL